MVTTPNIVAREHVPKSHSIICVPKRLAPPLDEDAMYGLVTINIGFLVPLYLADVYVGRSDSGRRLRGLLLLAEQGGGDATVRSPLPRVVRARRLRLPAGVSDVSRRHALAADAAAAHGRRCV